MVEAVENVDKRRKGTVGVGINDAPIWLIKEFTSLAKERYNDQYWVCLMDLMRKAEAWDVLVETGNVVPVTSDVPIVENKEDDGEVITMAGQRINKR